ncbi:MAG: hypothetical protein LBQ97_02180 [Fusobacteriaceae bacterium]|jgi:hypothetical protein|nr:hypothetical protein [Fusobacteriaceae bacterium]
MFFLPFVPVGLIGSFHFVHLPSEVVSAIYYKRFFRFSQVFPAIFETEAVCLLYFIEFRFCCTEGAKFGETEKRGQAGKKYFYLKTQEKERKKPVPGREKNAETGKKREEKLFLSVYREKKPKNGGFFPGKGVALSETAREGAKGFYFYPYTHLFLSLCIAGKANISGVQLKNAGERASNRKKLYFC